MFRSLKQEIQARQLLIQEDRLLLSAHAHALAYQLRRKLATPQALGASFGIGALAALLRCRRPAGEAQEEAQAGPSQMLRLAGWLLRDVVMPVALGALTQQAAREDAELP